MEAPEHLVKVIHTEAERLAESLQTLPPEAWSTPSACALWEVGDVVAHLVFVAEFYADVIARGVRGDDVAMHAFPGLIWRSGRPSMRTSARRLSPIGSV